MRKDVCVGCFWHKEITCEAASRILLVGTGLKSIMSRTGRKRRSQVFWDNKEIPSITISTAESWLIGESGRNGDNERNPLIVKQNPRQKRPACDLGKERVVARCQGWLLRASITKLESNGAFVPERLRRSSVGINSTSGWSLRMSKAQWPISSQ